MNKIDKVDPKILSHYGKVVNYEILDPSGQEWNESQGVLNGSIISEIEQGTVRNVSPITPCLELDLSFSGLVARIQNDKTVGRDYLISISDDYMSTRKKVEEAESDLQRLKTKLVLLKKGTDHVMNHLQMSKPLAIVVNDGVIVISDKDITLEKNVLK